MKTRTTREQAKNTVELKKLPVKKQVSRVINELIEPCFPNASYDLVSINIDIPTLGKILGRKIDNSPGRVLTANTLPLAQEFYNAITKSRVRLVDAYELL